MRYVMTMCLVCGEHSDPDINDEDAFDWNQEHQAENGEWNGHPDVYRFHRVVDGEHYVLRTQAVGGFSVGDKVRIVDSNALWAAEGKNLPEVMTIEGFEVLGYQGIVARVHADHVEYLDYIEKVAA